jgi:glycosyltransferase involved in cell wall biosynthesis
VVAAVAVADEVVVVDSGSTDATVAIAEAAGARVVHQDWLGNGRQKRFAEEQCRHDFLLDLDGDEVLSPALAEEIRGLFRGGPPRLPIYLLELVMVPPTGRPWYGFWQARRAKLYDRRVVRAPDHKAWDQFVLPFGVEVGRLSAPLFHYSFRDLTHLMAKLNRSSTVRATETHQRGRLAVAARVLFGFPVYFAKHYLQRGLIRAGVYGFALAAILAYARWLRDAKMYEAMLLRRPGRDVSIWPGNSARPLVRWLGGRLAWSAQQIRQALGQRRRQVIEGAGLARRDLGERLEERGRRES